MIFTGYTDKKDCPILVGDVLKSYHFTTGNRRKVYQFWQVYLENGVPHCRDLVENDHHESFTLRSVFLQCEILTGPSVFMSYAPKEISNELICFWERKRIPVGAWHRLGHK